MKIIALNLDIHWKSPFKNFETIEKKLLKEEADLFLLPEMFSTGFCTNTHIIADDSERTLNWMKNFAKQKKTAIAGSVSIKENHHLYNRFYFVEASGKSHQYDKKHLFSYGNEDQLYQKGSNRIIVDYMGFKILLLICYDIRFPVFSRNRDDYHAIICVANWPETRIDAWKTLLKARAIENQSYVFGVNRTGSDGNNLHYPKSSFSFFADGSEISEQKNELTLAKWDIEKLCKFRKQFPFLKDKDKFELL